MLLVKDHNGAYAPLETIGGPQTVPDPATMGLDGEEIKKLESSLTETDENIDNAVGRYSCDGLQFVETNLFQGLSACMVLLNALLMGLEQHDPRLEDIMNVPDILILCFYTFELLCRLLLYRSRFLCGTLQLVVFNLLDLIVVTAGVIDQWIFPLLQLNPHGLAHTALKALRLLRLLRVFKIIRIFLEADLSWAEQPRFQSFVGLVITLNALLMGFETDISWKGWSYIEQVLLVIYSFELAVHLKHLGLYYISLLNPDIGWNVLDFTIVVSSVGDAWAIPLMKLLCSRTESDQRNGEGLNLSQLMMLMRMLRLMRILRLVKLVKSVRPLYVLVTSIAAAVQGVLWVLVLCVVSLYALGILATRLIGHGVVFDGDIDNPEDNEFLEVFSSVSNSMFTLFRVMSGAQSSRESDAIDFVMRKVPPIKCGFVFFMVFSSWTLLSILTAVVNENMLNTTARQMQDIRLQCDEDDRVQHQQELKALFQAIDVNGSGTVELEELVDYVSDPDNARWVVKCIRVPKRNVIEVTKMLGRNGKLVHMDQFIECMLQVSRPVQEQSIMRLEAQLQDMRGEVQKAAEQQQLLLDQMAAINATVPNMCFLKGDAKIQTAK